MNNDENTQKGNIDIEVSDIEIISPDLINNIDVLTK